MTIGPVWCRRIVSLSVASLHALRGPHLRHLNDAQRLAKGQNIGSGRIEAAEKTLPVVV